MPNSYEILLRSLINDSLNISEYTYTYPEGSQEFYYPSRSTTPHDIMYTSEHLNLQGVTVKHNDVTITDYLLLDNHVLFNSTNLTSGDSLEISYSYYNNYGSDELELYTNKSRILCRKVLGKLVNVTVNNSSPELKVQLSSDTVTEEETNLVATITAILILPEEVSFRIPTLTVSNTKAFSKSSRIREVLINYTRSKVGVN